MSPFNVHEALREVELDINEGTDIVIVKPALPYLDIVKAVKDKFKMPTAAYQVSGEYSMIMAAIKLGYLTNDSIIESLISIKRAGADLIISHFTPWFLENQDDNCLI